MYPYISYHVYQSEIFPASVRSTAICSTYSLSRIVPFVLLPVLNPQSAGAMFGIIAAALVTVTATIPALGPRTTRRSQDEINPVQTNQAANFLERK
jgi:putative MFS transporter